MTGMSYSTLNAGSSRATNSFNFQKNYFPIVYVFACARMGGVRGGHHTMGRKRAMNMERADINTYIIFAKIFMQKKY